MRDLLDKIVPEAGQGGSLDTVLHLGAGDGRATEGLKARRLVLVEPDAELIPQLRRRERIGVEVIAAAVAAEAGPALLNCFNLAAFSSLREPSEEMAALFPGLRQIRQQEVATLALADLVRSLDLTEAQDNLIILETPGLEAELLDVLLAAEEALSERFRHLLLRAGRRPLYAKGVPLDRLADRLAEGGYRLVARNDDDPDVPCLLLHLDAGKLLMHRNAALREARAQAADLEARMAAAETKRIAWEEEEAKRLAELTARLNRQHEVTARLQARAAALSAELEHEQGLRQRLQGEFARLEGQMDLMRDYLLRPPKP